MCGVLLSFLQVRESWVAEVFLIAGDDVYTELTLISCYAGKWDMEPLKSKLKFNSFFRMLAHNKTRGVYSKCNIRRYFLTERHFWPIFSLINVRYERVNCRDALSQVTYLHFDGGE